MEKIDYEEVVDWKNQDKKSFDSWELDKIQKLYTDISSSDNISNEDKELLNWAENVLGV